MSTMGLGKSVAVVATLVGNIRIFALWGILDAIVYQIAKGCRIKSMLIYLSIFFALTVLAFYSPAIMEYL
jgi:hypothetical protein